MFLSQQGLQDDPHVANLVDLLRANYMYPSAITQWRYEQLNQNLGHVLPCRRTGNKHPEKMPGQDLIYLALYRVAYPKCIIAEMISKEGLSNIMRGGETVRQSTTNLTRTT